MPRPPPLVYFLLPTPEEQVIEELLIATLEHCNGNRVQAAKALGVSLRTVTGRISRLRERGRVIPHSMPGRPYVSPKDKVRQERLAKVKELLDREATLPPEEEDYSSL